MGNREAATGTSTISRAKTAALARVDTEWGTVYEVLRRLELARDLFEAEDGHLALGNLDFVDQRVAVRDQFLE